MPVEIRDRKNGTRRIERDEHPRADASLETLASLRPVMTNRLCTPPSLVPSGFFLKRASRMGPFCTMNHGTTFFAPFSVAIAIEGLAAGLDPPTPGCACR